MNEFDFELEGVLALKEELLTLLKDPELTDADIKTNIKGILNRISLRTKYLKTQSYLRNKGIGNTAIQERILYSLS